MPNRKMVSKRICAPSATTFATNPAKNKFQAKLMPVLISQAWVLLEICWPGPGRFTTEVAAKFGTWPKLSQETLWPKLGLGPVLEAERSRNMLGPSD